MAPKSIDDNLAVVKDIKNKPANTATKAFNNRVELNIVKLGMSRPGQSEKW